MVKFLQFVLVLFLLVSPCSVYGQKIVGGVKTGINISNVYGLKGEGAEYRVGIYLGGYMNLPIKGRFLYNPEIVYSQQGWNSTLSDGNEVIGESKITLNYLNLQPATFKMYIGESGLFNIIIGPQLGILLSSRDKGEFLDEPKDRPLDNINTLDFSGVFGIGIDLPSALNLGARMNVGLTDISSDRREWPDGDRPPIKNIAYQIFVGYSFIKH